MPQVSPCPAVPALQGQCRHSTVCSLCEFRTGGMSLFHPAKDTNFRVSLDTLSNGFYGIIFQLLLISSLASFPNDK